MVRGSIFLATLAVWLLLIGFRFHVLMTRSWQPGVRLLRTLVAMDL